MFEALLFGIVRGLTEFFAFSSTSHQLFIICVTASAMTGLTAIKFLMNCLKKHPVTMFASYRIILAAVIIFGIWLKG